MFRWRVQKELAFMVMMTMTNTIDLLMQSYPTRALDRRLQVDWAKDVRECPRVLMSLKVDFGPMG